MEKEKEKDTGEQGGVSPRIVLRFHHRPPKSGQRLVTSISYEMVRVQYGTRTRRFRAFL
jgi:hypothetical protein